MNATEAMNFINHYRNNYNNYNTLPKTYAYFTTAIQDIFNVLVGNEQSNPFKAEWECIKWEMFHGDGEFDREAVKSFRETLARIQL
jgi:hypothetical protein